MATRHWVKVWHEILIDLTFQDLPLEQQARYYTLLVYVSAQGERGVLKVQEPARALVSLLQCDDYEHLVNVVKSLVKLSIDLKLCDGGFIVTFKKWHKYQVDSSAGRTRKYRQNVTVQEKEKEEDKEKEKEEDKTRASARATPTERATGRDTNLHNPASHDLSAMDKRFDKFWAAYPNRKAKGRAKLVWQKLKPGELLVAQMCATIQQAKTSVEWTEDGGKFIPHPSTWLNAQGWEDEYTSVSTGGSAPSQDDMRRKAERERMEQEAEERRRRLLAEAQGGGNSL